jgi:crotonobetainyl-CoA:carnitine CoA-transferase CaiB-like acyl-CoA transferase
MRMVDLALAGIRELELAQGGCGPFCRKLLAELGVQVVTVEPIIGEITRHQALFAHDHPDPKASLVCRYLDTTKRAITPHLGCWAGRRLFEALLPHVDVVISDHIAPASAIVPPQPHLIYTSSGPCGLNGSHAESE